MTLRILLVDDHKLFREGLRGLLDAQPDLEVVGEASSGEDALQRVGEVAPDVAVIDFSMPRLDGLGVIDELRRRGAAVSCILLTMHNERELARRAIALGARGVVLKDDAFNDLASAIRAATDGEPYLSRSLGRNVASGVEAELSSREREVLGWIARGQSNKQIAHELGVSLKTVDTHRQRLMRKLDLHNTADLVRYAVRSGIAAP